MSFFVNNKNFNEISVIAYFGWWIYFDYKCVNTKFKKNNKYIGKKLSIIDALKKIIVYKLDKLFKLFKWRLKQKGSGKIWHASITQYKLNNLI